MKHKELKDKSQIFFTVCHSAGDKFSRLKVLNTKKNRWKQHHIATTYWLTKQKIA